MSNHRAEKRAVSRRSSVDVRGTSDSVVERSGPSAGKRRAVKPGRAGREQAVVATPRVRSTHGGLRKTLLPGIPSAPTLIGAAALLLAAAGAVTVSSPDDSPLATGNVQKLSAQASALSGASSIGSSNAVSGRARAVSRDSQRDALKDAADQDLQDAAEAQAKERNAALAALAASAEKQASLIAKNAWQLPVTAGVYHLTSRFGECSGLWSHCHTGPGLRRPERHPRPRGRQRHGDRGRLRPAPTATGRSSPSRTAPSCGTATRRRTPSRPVRPSGPARSSARWAPPAT